MPLDTQLDLFLDCRRMAERGALWLLRHRRPPIDIAAAVAQFQPGIAELARALEPVLVGRMADVVRSGEASRLAAGVPEDLAERAGVWPLLHTGFDLVEVAAGPRARRAPTSPGVDWAVFDRLDLMWLWDGIGALPRSDRWQTQARSAVRDDLLTALAELTATVIDSADGSVDAWMDANERSVARAAGDVHRDPPGRELRPDDAVGRPAPAAQPRPDVGHPVAGSSLNPEGLQTCGVPQTLGWGVRSRPGTLQERSHRRVQVTLRRGRVRGPIWGGSSRRGPGSSVPGEAPEDPRGYEDLGPGHRIAGGPSHGGPGGSRWGHGGRGPRRGVEGPGEWAHRHPRRCRSCAGRSLCGRR